MSGTAWGEELAVPGAGESVGVGETVCISQAGTGRHPAFIQSFSPFLVLDHLESEILHLLDLGFLLVDRSEHVR